MKSQLESMTGFGEHRARLKGLSFICRAKSLNHRFLDLKLRLPRADLAALDLAIRKRAGEVFKRGAVELNLSVETGAEASAGTLNASVAASYAKEARALAKKLKLKSKEPSIDGLLRLPGVVESSGSDALETGLAQLSEAEIMKQVVEPALQALKATRRAEGKKLAAVLIAHLDEMQTHVDAIKTLEGPEKEKARAQITTRAQDTLKLLASVAGANPKGSDEFAARLREEAVFWIERRDFHEERTRLEIHLKEFRKLISEGPETAGRKLEFLQQEVLREINTLGNKAQSPTVSTHTIELKTILERIREQLANVE